MKTLVSLSLAAAVTISSCASIVSKSDWPVSIQSTPSGVPFTITNKAGQIISSGKTPQSITLKSGAGYFSAERYTLQFVHKGKLTTRELTAELNGWYIGNLGFGFLIGFLIVDPLTGAMYRLPESVNQNLEPIQVGESATPELRIVSIAELSDAQKALLIPLE